MEAFIDDVVANLPVLPLHALDHALQLVPREKSLCVECGVYEGNTIRKIAAVAERVYGFDSFEGLPEDWGRPDIRFDAGHFKVAALPAVPRNVTLVKGWFEDTLPPFVREHAGETISLLHVDCDLYSSTRTVLRELRPMLAEGTIIVFDELLDYPTFEQHEIKACYEFLQETGFGMHWIGKLGETVRHPTRDRGAQFQSVAGRLVGGRPFNLARCAKSKARPKNRYSICRDKLEAMVGGK